LGKAAAAVGMGVNSRALAQRAKDLPAFFNAVSVASQQKFIAQTGAVLITDATGTTDVSGVFTAVLTSTVTGTKTVSATIAGTAITQAARYRGETDGQQMSLVVTLEGGQSAGEYSLAKGGRARLFKCR